MRYFLELAYNGTRFCGYQIQQNGYTIQEEIETALATILRIPTPIVGCGRTDTGVHALQYFAHFDSTQILDYNFVYKLNTLTSKDIVFERIIPVKEDAHARFDATSRSYKYYISLKRSPFGLETAYFCPYHKELDIPKMQAAAQLLLQYQDFTTFCKSKTDTKTNLCDLRKSEWIYDKENNQLIYHVTANRFLRGMIRLIVGMSLHVGKGKYSLEVVKEALEKKATLQYAFSAPAKGLFLMDIEYDYI